MMSTRCRYEGGRTREWVGVIFRLSVKVKLRIIRKGKGTSMIDETSELPSVRNIHVPKQGTRV